MPQQASWIELAPLGRRFVYVGDGRWAQHFAWAAPQIRAFVSRTGDGPVESRAVAAASGIAGAVAGPDGDPGEGE